MFRIDVFRGSGLVQDDGHDNHHDQTARHRDRRAANQSEGADARAACHSHDHGGNRRHHAGKPRRELHRHEKQDGRDAELLCEVGNERSEGEERSVAGAHHDAGDRDEGHDDDHDGVGRKTEVLRAGNEVVDRAGGDEALGEEFARNDEGDHRGELAAHHVEEFKAGIEYVLDGLAGEFTAEGDREGDEHGGRNVELDRVDHEAVEDDEQDERDHRQETVPGGSALDVDLFLLGGGFVDLVGLVAVLGVKVALREEVQGGDGDRHDDADGDLVLDEVGHRVHAGHLVWDKHVVVRYFK